MHSSEKLKRQRIKKMEKLSKNKNEDLIKNIQWNKKKK